MQLIGGFGVIEGFCYTRALGEHYSISADFKSITKIDCSSSDFIIIILGTLFNMNLLMKYINNNSYAKIDLNSSSNVFFVIIVQEVVA